MRDTTGVPKATAVPRDNVYGWYVKIGRGTYDIAAAGQAALAAYADVTAARVVKVGTGA